MGRRLLQGLVWVEDRGMRSVRCEDTLCGRWGEEKKLVQFSTYGLILFDDFSIVSVYGS